MSKRPLKSVVAGKKDLIKGINNKDLYRHISSRKPKQAEGPKKSQFDIFYG